MSEPAPEQQPQRSSGSVFTRKIGPLPLWAWMGIGLALALGYYYYRQNQAAKAASQQSSQSQSSTPSGTPSSLIPQFVNQVYTSGAPPEQPSTPASPSTPGTPTTPTGPSGPPLPTWPPTGPPVSSPGPPAVTQAGQYPAPTNEKVSKLSSTSGKVTWNYITSVTPKPTSYTVAVYQLNGKLAQQFTVDAPDTASGQGVATISGLHPGWAYNVNVWANGGKTAPSHSTAKLTLLWPGLMSKSRSLSWLSLRCLTSGLVSCLVFSLSRRFQAGMTIRPLTQNDGYAGARFRLPVCLLLSVSVLHFSPANRGRLSVCFCWLVTWLISMSTHYGSG